MKLYFSLIALTQTILMSISIVILLVLPFSIAFFPDTFTTGVTTSLYALAHYFLLFVMSVRPLADIIPKTNWIRPLVILRKGAGVFSASIIMSFIFAKIIIDPSNFFGSFGTTAYWSFTQFAIFAHTADISAFLLLITSNKLSKRLLGAWWKRIQRLSYVYFYGSSLYLYLVFDQTIMAHFMLFVTTITLLAFIKNQFKK
ncbi:MAG: hypothetical protein K9M10_04435 [Candidatus Pacebacteria bacterium]|nr:hypothetical protein [Candidatus Paceibacterota bacterium]MCF7857688.1 hypothetical protein [Candidatus Paceibacterota bacterium]